MDKLNIENRTLTKITPRERKEKRLWNAIALREAVINAMVHNDYTREVAPKFEIFEDRLEITSYGSLPEGLSHEEFFEGVSILRNKELMRIFKDLDLVEQLGSGIPRILQAYNKECFQFSENFLRVILPSSEASTPQVPRKYPASTPQVPSQIKKILQHLITGETKSRTELQEELNLSDREYFRKNYLLPAIKAGFIALTLPDKPTSSKQQYFLTQKGRDFLLSLE